ncbi:MULTISPECIES: hypothetical protein [unclassified Nostoc]|uniref:hypothetical protein n=1 Tax=unclassified Nostoc TaxID=2593658 RepID=UPI001CB89CB0|nr:hypothetical protein [Nostoc sp. 'Peltigera membranacea cyanobiont' 232]
MNQSFHLDKAAALLALDKVAVFPATLADDFAASILSTLTPVVALGTNTKLWTSAPKNAASLLFASSSKVPTPYQKSVQVDVLTAMSNDKPLTLLRRYRFANASTQILFKFQHLFRTSTKRPMIQKRHSPVKRPEISEK